MDVDADRLGGRAQAQSEFDSLGDSGGAVRRLPMPRTGAFLQVGQRPIQTDGLGRVKLKGSARAGNLRHAAHALAGRGGRRTRTARAGWRSSSGRSVTRRPRCCDSDGKAPSNSVEATRMQRLGCKGTERLGGIDSDAGLGDSDGEG